MPGPALYVESVLHSDSRLSCRFISFRGLAIFDALFLLTAILAFGIPKLWPWYHDNLFVYFMAASFGLLHTFR